MRQDTYAGVNAAAGMSAEASSNKDNMDVDGASPPPAAHSSGEPTKLQGAGKGKRVTNFEPRNGSSNNKDPGSQSAVRFTSQRTRTRFYKHNPQE
eukprot:909760-Prorocentrum_minimum.AAC.5